MARMNGSRAAICAAVLAVFLLAAGGQAYAADKGIWWDDGGSGHNWTVADNWDPAWGGGPGNDGYWEFLVTIGCQPDPNDPIIVYDPVTFNINAPVEVTDLFLCRDSRLVLDPDAPDPNDLDPNAGLIALRTTEIDGIIDGQGGNFTACGPSVTFPLNRTRIEASDSSLVTICVPAYSSAGLQNTTTILNAEGEGSAISFPTATSLSTAFDDSSTTVRYHTIMATNGGEIALSAVAQIDPPARREDYARFILRGELSTINLTELETINDPDDDPSGDPNDIPRGYTEFIASDCAIQNMPDLTTMRRTLFDLTSGAQLHVNGPPATYSSEGMYWQSRTIMSADGVGGDCASPTLLDLSSVTSLSAAFDDGSTTERYHAITATNGSEIDLSALTQLDVPSRREDYVQFVLRDELSTINLDALPMINGTGGYTKFIGSDCAVQNLPSVTSIEDALFDLSSGAQLHVNGPPATYSSEGMYWQSTTIMSAGGIGVECANPTLLDLSTVTSLSTAFDDSSTTVRYHRITATDGAKIDLSAVTQLDPPVRPEDYAWFTISGAGSTLDLSSLDAISSTSNGGLKFDIADGGYVRMGNVEVDPNRVETRINIGAGSVLHLGSLQACSPVSIVLTNPTARLEVDDYLRLGDDITIAAPTGGTLSLGGDFRYTWPTSI